MRLLVAAALARSVPLAGVTGYAQTVISLAGGAPLAYWRRINNGTINDVRPGARHAAITGAAADATGLPQNSDDGGVNFNGVASASVPDDAGLHLAAFSLSFWFRTNTMQAGEETTLFPLITKDDGTASVSGDFQVVYAEDGFLRVRFQDGTTNWLLNSPPGSVIEGQTHHVLVRANNTGFEAFLDGELLEDRKETGYTAGWTNNTVPLLFAASQVPTDGLAHAVLDEIALYPRFVPDNEVFLLAQRTADPVADADVAEVPESTSTPLNVVANDHFVGAKSDLVVAIMSQPGGGDTVAVDANNDIVYTSGAVTIDTTRSFSYRITDANGTSNTATVNVTVRNAVAPGASLPFFGQYYGGGWPSISNGEYELAANDHTWFFYAERSGTITGIRWAWRTDTPTTNYSAGDGGVYTIEIRTGNATTKREAAGSTLIARVAGISEGRVDGQRYFEYNFNSTGELTAGQPYVVKAINTHTNPAGNFSSMNTISCYVWNSTTGVNAIEPGDGPGAGSILAASGGVRGHVVGSSATRIMGYSPHSIDLGGTPFQLYPVPVGYEAGAATHNYRRMGGIHMSLRYSDGEYTNWGHGSGDPADFQFNITGTNQLRQRFRVSRANRTVSGVYIMGWANGTAGNLLVRLEQGPQNDTHAAANGTLMGSQISVPAGMFLDAGPTWTRNQFNPGGTNTALIELLHYVWVPFGQNHTLTVGQVYNLRLVPSGCDIRMIAGNRDDQRYGMLGRNASTWAQWELNRQVSWTCFEDSRGPQVSTNSGTSWAYGPAGAQQVPITLKIA